MTAVDAIPHGWSVSDKYREILAKLPTKNDVLEHLLNTDMREYGVAWIDSKKSKDSLDTNGQVLQVVRIRNIAISKIEEEFQFPSNASSGDGGGSRLLLLTLTDGKTNVSALDVDNSPQLSSETPPGTKIRLNGRIPIRMGFLILKRNNFEVLKGNVDSLSREWLLTRGAKGSRRPNRGGTDDPPPFVAFGTPEAAAVIASHNQFLNSLRNRNPQLDDTFDSFKLAMNATTKASAAAPGDDNDFQQKRREFLAEAQNTDACKAVHRFKPGISKFQQARIDMATERDRNLAQLFAMGFQLHEASTALKESNNNLDAAIERLTSHPMSHNIDLPRMGGGNSRRKLESDRGRGRGRGRGGVGGGKFDSILDEDPYFDPVAAAEKSGLRGKPSQGPVPLSELMDQPLPNRTNSSGPSTSFHRTPTLPNESRLSVGAALQAKVLSGEYEVAELVGVVSPTVNGERVAVVRYLTSGHQEQVPVGLLRTMDNKVITADMLPEVKNSASRNADTYRARRGGSAGNVRGELSRGFSRGRGGGGRSLTVSGPRGRAPHRRG